MVPKESGFNQSKRISHYAHAHCVVFQARLPWQGILKFYKGSIFFHHGDTICHPKSGYLTTKLHWMSIVDATIMRSFQTELFSCFLPVAYSGHINLAATQPWQFQAKVPRWRHCWIQYLSCSKFRFCLSIVSYIMIILSSGAVGYNVIGVYRWIFPKCLL